MINGRPIEQHIQDISLSDGTPRNIKVRVTHDAPAQLCHRLHIYEHNTGNYQIYIERALVPHH